MQYGKKKMRVKKGEAGNPQMGYGPHPSNPDHSDHVAEPVETDPVGANDAYESRDC